jgi:RNA polymerase sigma-70 factor (ECF subfamily)
MDGLLAQHLPGREIAADAALADAQQMQAVFREIDRLPKPERQALLLCALEELDHSEIARVMGRTESAVRALLFRARTRLRERLAKGDTR